MKSYETKSADAIQGRTEEDYLSRLNAAMTSVRGVNRTDVLTLGRAFGSVAGTMRVSSGNPLVALRSYSRSTQMNPWYSSVFCWVTRLGLAGCPARAERLVVHASTDLCSDCILGDKTLKVVLVRSKGTNEERHKLALQTMTSRCNEGWWQVRQCIHTCTGVWQAGVDELSTCPGIGPTKVRRLYDTFHEPFRRILRPGVSELEQPGAVTTDTVADIASSDTEDDPVFDVD